MKKELLNAVIRVFETNNVHVEVNNTICNATALRQKSCAELAEICDAMLIIGGRESSNTGKLFEISEKKCQKNHFLLKKSKIYRCAKSQNVIK